MIYEDNQAAISLSPNPLSRSRTKRIDTRYHFNREELQRGTIAVEYIPTNEMVADEPLSKSYFVKLRHDRGLEFIVQRLKISKSESVIDREF